MKIVIDTNVLIAALRSRKGASYKLFSLVQSGVFTPVLSLPLYLEYEEVIMRQVNSGVFLHEAGENLLDFICYNFEHQELHYQWRPMLNDPKDEMVLETLFNSRSQYLITYNKKDFTAVKELKNRILDAKEFLTLIGDIR